MKAGSGVLGLGLLLLVGFWGVVRIGATPGISSRGEGTRGLSGFRGLLEKQGWGVVAQREGVGKLPEGAGHVLILANMSLFRSLGAGWGHEVEGLKEWMKQGNTVIELSGWSTPLLRALDLHRKPPSRRVARLLRARVRRGQEGLNYQTGVLAPETRSRPRVVGLEPGEWDADPRSAVPLLVAPGELFVVALRRPFGDGSLVAIADPSLARNRNLAFADNARFLLDTVAAHRGPGGQVLFDDWHTVARTDTGVVAYARAQGYAMFLVQLWLLALAYLGFAWLRPTPGTPDDDPPARPQAADRARVLAQFHARALHREHAAKVLERRWRVLSSDGPEPATWSDSTLLEHARRWAQSGREKPK